MMLEICLTQSKSLTILFHFAVNWTTFLVFYLLSSSTCQLHVHQCPSDSHLAVEKTFPLKESTHTRPVSRRETCIIIQLHKWRADLLRIGRRKVCVCERDVGPSAFFICDYSRIVADNKTRKIFHLHLMSRGECKFRERNTKTSAEYANALRADDWQLNEKYTYSFLCRRRLVRELCFASSLANSRHTMTMMRITERWKVSNHHSFVCSWCAAFIFSLVCLQSHPESVNYDAHKWR